MANLKDTIVLGNLTVTGKINGAIDNSGGSGVSVINANPTLAWSTQSTVATIGGTAITLTMPANPNTTTAQGGYADYLTGFSGRSASISWGTLQTDYSFITRMDTANGGSIAFADKDGQTSMQIDGFFYQNEGNYKVLDESGGTISDKLNFTYGGTRRLRLWADGEGANIRMTTPGNANNCYEIDTCDNNLRIYYSTDDGGGANYKGLTLMDANGVTNFLQLPTYNGTNLVTATDLNNYVDKTSTQTISGIKTFTAANKFTGETQFTHTTYAPTWKDIAPGIGKSSCFTRGAFMQLITGQILFANGSCDDTTGSYNTEANKLKFQLINTADAAAPALTTIATMDSNGLLLNTGNIYFNNTNYAGVGIGTVPTQFTKEHGPAASTNYPIWIASAGQSNQTEGAGIMIDGQTIQMWAPMDVHPSFMDSDTGITWNIALSTSAIRYMKSCTASEYANLSKDSYTLYFIK